MFTLNCSGNKYKKKHNFLLKFRVEQNQSRPTFTGLQTMTSPGEVVEDEEVWPVTSPPPPHPRLHQTQSSALHWMKMKMKMPLIWTQHVTENLFFWLLLGQKKNFIFIWSIFHGFCRCFGVEEEPATSVRKLFLFLFLHFLMLDFFVLELRFNLKKVYLYNSVQVYGAKLGP